MREWLETDSGHKIEMESRNIFNMVCEWEELACVLSGPCEFPTTVYDGETDLLMVVFNPISKNAKTELGEFHKASDIIDFEGIRYLAVSSRDTDYIRVEDLKTKSSICAQKMDDGLWKVRLWEPLTTRPGTHFYRSFFEGVGVIPPNLKWEEYDYWEQSILEFAEWENQQERKAVDQYLADREMEQHR